MNQGGSRVSSRLTKTPSKAIALLDIESQSSEAKTDGSSEKEEGLFIPNVLQSKRPTDYPIDQLHRLHGYQPRNTEESKEAKGNDNQDLFQLLFDIKHCIFKAGEGTVLLFSVFDDTTKTYLTEEYSLNLTPNCFPTVGVVDECKVLFKDLTQQQLRNKLFIVCRIFRIGGMEAPDLMNNKKKKKQPKKELSVMRPYGVSVIRLVDCLPDLLKNLGEEVSFEPTAAAICCAKEELNFANLPYELIEEKRNTHTLAPLSIGIAHSLRLYRGNLGVVEKSYENFSALTVIESLEVNPETHSERHMLYVTVLDVHVNQRNKKTPCNVVVKLQLRDNETYEPLEAIMLGRGPMAPPVAEVESPVFYHTNDPQLNQTYVISIPSDIKEVEKYHLFLSCWHTSTKNSKDERGFAFMRLFDENSKQLKASKAYALQLFKLDRRSQNYLNNQQLKDEGKVVNVYFRLCSTKILPDLDIHRFMTWRHQPNDVLVEAIRRVGRKSFNDLVKVLDDFMRNIFGIMQSTKEQAVVDQCFFALVGMLGEVNKGINLRYKARIEGWISGVFGFPGVWRILGKEVLSLIRWIASPEAEKAEQKDAHPDLKRHSAEIVRQLTKTMRGVQYLFQMMKRSCELEVSDDQKSKERVESEYQNVIQQIFDALNVLMGLSKPKAVNGVQSFALRGFLSLFECMPQQDSLSMVQLCVKFVQSAQNKGVHNNVEKLLLIARILEHPLMTRKDLIEVFLPCMCQELSEHMGHGMDEQIACATILHQCAPFLNPKLPRVVRSTLFAGESKKVNDGRGVQVPPSLFDQFALLLLKMFPVIDHVRSQDLTEVTNAQRIFHTNMSKNPTRVRAMSIPTIHEISADQILIHRELLVTCATLSRIITECTGRPESFGDKSDRIDRVISELRSQSESEAEQVIDHVLMCCYNLLRHSLFPYPWLHMRMIEAELGLRAFSWFGSTLRRNYLGHSFNKELWNAWLGLGMAFLANRDFAIEDLDELRADTLTKNYGDIRQIAIKKLTSAWDVLTPHRSHLAETMVSAAVEASASNVPEIQEFAVNVFFQMMKSEFETTNEMKTVETHTIDQIDQLTAKFSTEERIINRYLDFFRVLVREKLAESNNARLREKGELFIAEIEQLYDYLVRLRRLPTDAEHEDERTTATFQLLNYLDRIGKQKLYNRYVHHLALMHRQLSNHIEAAVCYQMHASRLGWSEGMLRYEAQVELDEEPEWRRHVKLLENAHKHFMLGEAWEMGVRVCQELARVYETILFDLKALSAILEKQSQLWKFIAQHDRVFHACYLVSFRGDFESELKGQSYIYRSGKGKDPEPVFAFTNRIKSKFPDANVVNSADPIPAEFDTDDYKGQYIRITTLEPSSEEEMKGLDFVWDAKKAPLRMKQYYRQMEIQYFSYTFTDRSKIRKKENEFRSIWITRTFIQSADTVPSMRRRIPVVNETRIEYTPLQTAVNSLNSKTKELIKCVVACENDPLHNTNALSMLLNGILDAAVMGGVNKYLEAFFDGAYFKEYASEKERSSDFKDALRFQMVEAEKAHAVYSMYCHESLRDHVEHLEGCLKKMKLDLKDFLKS